MGRQPDIASNHRDEMRRIDRPRLPTQWGNFARLWQQMGNNGSGERMAKIKSRKNVPEIPLIGDVDEWEADAIKALLEVPEEGECVFYLDSAGGSVYGALAVVAMIRLRQLQPTVLVLGECSSAAIMIFGACKRRIVTPLSTFLFHRMRWQSEKRIAAEEAGQWAKHFEELENEMDALLGKMLEPIKDRVKQWAREGRFLTGREMAAAGLAELIEI